MLRQLAGPLRRTGVHLLRNRQTRGGGGAGWTSKDFWSEGSQEGYNGFLFGEIPTGKPRQWQWWEGMWYTGYGAFFLSVFLIYTAKPPEAFDIKHWARPRAEAELQIEQKMMDKLNARPDLKERLVAVGKQLNMIEAEAYDLILMRNEYKVKLGLHSGRVPAELADIYSELASD